MIMRKILRRVVPLLLILVLLGSMVWYVFVYDRTFIRDLLVSGARFSADFGYEGLSSTFYDMAYNHSGQDEGVAIELARQYKDRGNYTKAEYTLSRAIADGGTSELYMALCQIYVEQNKLMDAVAMLDNIADPAIKAELDAQRPIIDVINPAPGYYSQYVSVSLSATHGTIYYSNTREYPSLYTEPYGEAMPLPNGETTLMAVAVAENGLVSPLCKLGYTIGGVVEPVTLEDPAIDRAVREILHLGADEEIFTDALWTITEFTVPQDAVTLKDLSRLNYLERLTITDVRIDSLESLSTLKMLQFVDLSGSRFPASELSVLGALPELKILKLSNCGLSTIAGLENAQSLTKLYLDYNTLRNLSPISHVVTLQELYLQHNAVLDLSQLKELSQLQILDASYNAITMLGGASSLQKLTHLNLESNNLQNLTGLDQLSNLTYLNLSYNQLDDVDALAGCVNLTELNISNNQITKLDSLKSLTKVKILNLANNQVKTLPSWAKNCALYSIDASYNQIETLSALGGMENLAYVYMDYNNLTSILPLMKCDCLVQVNVFGNQITDVDGLTKQSIIVHYDPTA